MEALNFIKIYKGDLNEEFILKIHSLILKNISERFAGKYRETNVRIFGSDVKLPNYFLVPQLMKNLIYWYKKNKKNYHPIEMAILISMKLVTIHPFVDGNGRVFRLIMNFLLNKKKYPWINIYNKQRQRYLLAVRKANDEHYDLIFPFLIDTLKENLKDFNLL
ncbi:Fic family protein, partial [Candidatus Woesearchaeota archaeon]|nr:Fic family protein [Candidatus Woesearchaeota archaeon]